jgi:hypothetical protein
VCELPAERQTSSISNMPMSVLLGFITSLAMICTDLGVINSQGGGTWNAGNFHLFCLSGIDVSSKLIWLPISSIWIRHLKVNKAARLRHTPAGSHKYLLYDARSSIEGKCGLNDQSPRMEGEQQLRHGLGVWCKSKYRYSSCPISYLVESLHKRTDSRSGNGYANRCPSAAAHGFPNSRSADRIASQLHATP